MWEKSLEDDQRCYIENQTETKFLFHHFHQLAFNKVEVYFGILQWSNQLGEKNLVAISQIIILQLLIIIIVKKIIIVSKYIFFIQDGNISNLWGLFHYDCSYHYTMTLIDFWYK